MELLDAGFVRNGWIGVRTAGGRVSWVFVARSVDLVEILCLKVVGFEFFVRNWPGWGDAAMVANLAEVFFPQAKQGSTIEFGVPADEVVGVGMKGFTILVGP